MEKQLTYSELEALVKEWQDTLPDDNEDESYGTHKEKASRYIDETINYTIGPITKHSHIVANDSPESLLLFLKRKLGIEHAIDKECPKCGWSYCTPDCPNPRHNECEDDKEEPNPPFSNLSCCTLCGLMSEQVGNPCFYSNCPHQ